VAVNCDGSAVPGPPCISLSWGARFEAGRTAASSNASFCPAPCPKTAPNKAKLTVVKTISRTTQILAIPQHPVNPPSTYCL